MLVERERVRLWVDLKGDWDTPVTYNVLITGLSPF